MSYTVFISHSTKDRFIARQVAELIEQAGREHDIDTFLDEKDIEYGGSISEEIRQQIRDCGELVVLLSEYSIDRPWVLGSIKKWFSVNLGAANRVVRLSVGYNPEHVLFEEALHDAAAQSTGAEA